MGVPAPGPGPYPLPLAVPTFYILCGLLALFIGMFYLLLTRPSGRRRGVEGFVEAAGIDLAFLVASFLLVVALALGDPHGNRTALALYEVVIGGYWLAFAIPLVTVGCSVHHRSRGSVPWRIPSILGAAALFGVIFAVYYAV